MSEYQNKPPRLLARVVDDLLGNEPSAGFCAGFELEKWRCTALADHLIDWIADYALKEDELNVNHANMYVRLKQAAVRVYSSKHYEKRGEIGEIALHAICRDFWETIPIAPRIFYLSSSNDVVKSFDLVHMRCTEEGNFELWLGEAKFYKDADSAIGEAISSVNAHIDQGFLNREKLLLGPQLSKDIPHYDEIRELLSSNTSLDALFSSAVFPMCILANSGAAASSKKHCDEYSNLVTEELEKLNKRILNSGLRQKIKIILIYVPLGSKDDLATAFDTKIKGLTA